MGLLFVPLFVVSIALAVKLPALLDAAIAYLNAAAACAGG